MESSNQINNTPQPQDDISLKEIILRLNVWIKFLFSKKIIIIVFACIGAGIGFVYAFSKKPSYIAELTFVLEDNKSSPLGAYMGLASQFGIDLSSSMGGSGVFSGDNIMEFLKSRLIIERALLSPVIKEGNKKYSLADLYIDFNDLRDKWEGPYLQNMHFPANADRNGFTIQQDSILFMVYNNLLKKNLDVTKPDKKLSFIAVDCISDNEQFSKLFTEQLVKEATNFYIETKTKRSKDNVDKLQLKADSLEALLRHRSYSSAMIQDLNQNPARKAATVNLESIQRDKMIAETMYGEVIKNLELAKIAMLQDAPVIQIVDSPILPLEKKKFGKLKGLVLGGFLGGFLTIIYLVIRKLWRSAFD